MEEKSIGVQNTEAWTTIVEKQGDPVGLNTKDCLFWNKSHPSCQGCPFELGCAKTVALMGVALQPIFYQPIDYDDFAKMQSAIQVKLDKILKAKTIEEIHSVNW